MKSTAEARLDAALAAAGVEDPRPALRMQLKRLRTQDESAFDRAVRMYEDDVVPALAGDGPALDTWLTYTQRLGELLSPGSLVAIDPTGRATSFTPPYRPGDLVLHVPEQTTVPAIAAAVPARPAAPQQATLDLLVCGRLGS